MYTKVTKFLNCFVRKSSFSGRTFRRNFPFFKSCCFLFEALINKQQCHAGNTVHARHTRSAKQLSKRLHPMIGCSIRVIVPGILHFTGVTTKISFSPPCFWQQFPDPQTSCYLQFLYNHRYNHRYSRTRLLTTVTYIRRRRDLHDKSKMAREPGKKHGVTTGQTMFFAIYFFPLLWIFADRNVMEVNHYYKCLKCIMD